MLDIRTFSIALLAVLSFSSDAAPTIGPDSKVVFYLDETYRSVVRLDRIHPLSEGTKAILAMYALQNGAGCEGRNEEGLECTLTTALGLGTQCSAKQISIVRSWFTHGMPKLSGYADTYYKDIQQPEGLEGICYSSPEGASIQRVWDLIRIKQSGKHITVVAHGSWVAREESGSFEYLTKYEVGQKSIKVISHKELPISAKQ